MVTGIVSQSVGAARASFRAAERRNSARRGTQNPAGRDERHTSDALPRSIRRAAGLEGFCGDAVALAPPARATAAARAFSAGNGYLSGLIVDRLA